MGDVAAASEVHCAQKTCLWCWYMLHISLTRLSAVQAHIQSGELREGLKTVVDLLHKAQLPMTRTMRALLLEGSLLEDDLQAHSLLMHVQFCLDAVSISCLRNAQFGLPLQL